MIKLTRQEIFHIAKLSKLDLTESETEKFQDQLSVIIDHVSVLSSIDTAGLEPTSQTTGLENVYRGDQTAGDRCLNQEKALSGADATHNGYFKVGAILSERTDK